MTFGEAMPEIRVTPPGPQSRAMLAKLQRNESAASLWAAEPETPIVWARAQGACIEDVDGNVFIDWTGGFSVAVAGHGNPAIVAAIQEQAGRLLHAQGVLNPSDRRVELSELLTALVPRPLEVVHLTTTGSEAIDVAMKTAVLATGRSHFLAFQDGYHGKGLAGTTLSANRKFRAPFASVLGHVAHLPSPYAYRSPFGGTPDECADRCLAYITDLLDNPASGVVDVAAMIIEPVQGNGGWIVPPPHFLRGLRALCDRHGILLIFDEIITGFGRTGRWFGGQHSGVTPDLMTCGKGMASGMPISAVVGTRDAMRHWTPMLQTSTFLGNPVCAAAAIASLAEIERLGLVDRAARMGERFNAALRALAARHPLIGEVRGIGMLQGIELVRDRATKEPAAAEAAKVAAHALRNGLHINNRGGRLGNVLKFSPPLVLTDAQLDRGLAILDDALGAVEAEMSRAPAAART
ncbi:MAG: aspartate aminotransferase family protein [Armatimonadetes bacterium]|nr:aspartate aminotransferase family protein [Armatimonadota bacterium]